MKLNKGDVLFCEYLDSDWVNRRYYFTVVSTDGGIRVRELDGWYDGSIQETVAPIYRFERVACNTHNTREERRVGNYFRRWFEASSKPIHRMRVHGEAKW